MAKTYLEEYYDDPERMRSLQQERLIFEIAQQMWHAMRERNVNCAQLAQMLGLTKGRVSQILNGRANLTLRSTADIFTALNKTLVTTQRELFVLEPPDPRNAPFGTMYDGWGVGINKWPEVELPQHDAGPLIADCAHEQLCA